MKTWGFVPCAPSFMEALSLREPLHTSGYLIEYEGKPIRWNMDSSLSSAAKQAKVPPPCFYDIRHLWITTMLDAGASAAAVAEMPGTSIRMIMSNYYEVNRAEKARAVGLLPQLTDKTHTAKVVNLNARRK